MTDSDARILNAFAKVLRQHRTQAGLSQEELAHRAGLSMRYVSLLESRKHQPSLGTVDALARSLGLTLTAFIAEVDAQARAGTG
ncbi:helix-turn-helix transcriptional regulator [Paracoccus denitrificans]|uniref:helix-turn-helix domain-containing protein n=1 Tax=Paracoccus denitrificans TaxID=266 RepID=UPI001E5EF9C6|nr:helix-turn-helix transcriptional regulator [Paracoccus denitrificans]UFS64702.1 helix-turn-helix transcriptional regulator [Paracoccus denitrificans]